MGRAAVAAEGDFQGVRWNPAILGSVNGLAPLASRYDGPLDFTVNHFALAVPAGAVGTLAFGLEIQSFGEITISGDEPSGAPLGQVTPSNLIASVGFSRRIMERLLIGGTAKLIRSKLIADLVGNTVAADLGLLWQPSRALPLRLGLSALNLGPGLKLGDDAEAAVDPLPSRLRLGAAYDLLDHVRGDDDWELLFAFDAEHAVRDPGTGSQFIGAELGAKKTMYIRAGFISETLIETSTGTAFGFGLRLGAFLIDMAFEQGVNQLGYETHISLGAMF